MSWSVYRPKAAPASDGWSVYRPPKRHAPTRPRPVKPVRQRVVDPFAATSDAQLQARAQALAQAQTGPLLQQLQQAIEARSRSGSAAIGGYTQQLGNLFSQVAPQTAGIYNEAIKQQSGTNTALANRLGSFGQGLAGEVGNKLAYAGPSGQSVASNTGVVGQGAANAGFAKGAAETGMLNAHSAAAQAYGAKLPGIAGLTGLQSVKQLQAQLSQEFADKAGQITAHAQDIFSNIYQHELDMEWQKTLARQSGQFKSAQAVADAKYKAQLVAYKNATLAWRRAQAAADRKLRAQSQAETARHHTATEAAANRAAAERARADRAREAQQRRNETGRNKRSGSKGKRPSGNPLVP
jgi:hypothetical protein